MDGELTVGDGGGSGVGVVAGETKGAAIVEGQSRTCAGKITGENRIIARAVRVGINFNLASGGSQINVVGDFNDTGAQVGISKTKVIATRVKVSSPCKGLFTTDATKSDRKVTVGC